MALEIFVIAAVGENKRTDRGEKKVPKNTVLEEKVRKILPGNFCHSVNPIVSIV